jgi:hypothetical protein
MIDDALLLWQGIFVFMSERLCYLRPSLVSIGQTLAGVTNDPVTPTIFVIISSSGIILGIVTLKNIRDSKEKRKASIRHRLVFS